MSSWDIFTTNPVDGKPPLSTRKMEASRRDVLRELAEEYFDTSIAITELQKRYEKISGEIAHLFPVEAGEKTETLDDLHITVKRTEKYVWDRAELERIYEQGELPEFLSRTLSIHKRTYDRMPEDEKGKVSHALTKNLNTPKVEVRR